MKRVFSKYNYMLFGKVMNVSFVGKVNIRIGRLF